MPRVPVITLVLGSLLAVAACGALPQPFAGNPGTTALRLAQPPPARLLIGEPTDALLTHDAAIKLAVDVAHSLEAREVPAAAGSGGGGAGDWRLVIGADLQSGQVVPSFSVRDPKGVEKGTTAGAPVAADAWQAADAATLQQTADKAAPDIASLLERIEAQREESDPNSLLNRPVRVALKGVSGAPGDGDRSLAHEFSLELPKHGEPLQKSPAGADFLVEGRVKAVPEPEDTIRIELQWVVTNAAGQELGRVVQINEVPKDAVSGLWGDVAVVAAAEAAGGVQDVIARNVGLKREAAGLPSGRIAIP
jgi:hypothetical protein